MPRLAPGESRAFSFARTSGESRAFSFARTSGESRAFFFFSRAREARLAPTKQGSQGMTTIDGKADTILAGGPIWCGLAQGTVEALALRDGKVLAAGQLSDVEMLVGPGTRRIELRGRLAIPGFHDAHMHLMSLGRRARRLVL